MGERTGEIVLGVRENVPLAPLTTFKVGGPARYYAEARNADDVRAALRFAREKGLPFAVIGGGANILVADRGYTGLVLRVVDNTLTINETSAIAGAGLPIGRFLQQLARSGLSGLEYIIGVPGTVGGAIVGNAGTASEWIGHRLERVTIYNTQTGQEVDLTQRECAFRYRMSRFKGRREEVVLCAVFSLEPRPTEEIRKSMTQYLDRRRHQPAGDACAGCIFVNPEANSAGRLIDEAGLKGRQIGKAKVSEDHANFIVNTGGATANEIAMLISYVKQQVRDRLGVQLMEEIRYLGFD